VSSERRRELTLELVIRKLTGVLNQSLRARTGVDDLVV
jgi:hypothetical protein